MLFFPQQFLCGGPHENTAYPCVPDESFRLQLVEVPSGTGRGLLYFRAETLRSPLLQGQPGSTYAAAGEGNVYLLPRDAYLTFASSGLCAALEEDEELMAILDGVDLQRGWKKNDAGENHICGIPQDKLPGLSQYAYADNGFLCVLVTNKNPENTMKFFRIFCRDMLTAPVQIQE